jgi:peptidase S41-like protein/tricorn protease-like protein
MNVPQFRSAIAVIGAVSIIGAASVSAQSLDGSWTSEGYGLYFDVSGATIKAFEVTAVSCLPAFTAQRAGNDPGGGVFYKAVDQPTTWILRQGGSTDRRLLHQNGSASDVVITRQKAAPDVCAKPTPDTPVSNFDVFARTWAEQYGFFDIKKADWPAIVAKQRPRVTEGTTPQELFQILREMIEPFEDAHTSISARSINQGFSSARKSANWLERPDRPRAFEIVEQKYARTPLRSWCNGQVQYGRLDGGVGYLRIKGFSGYGSSFEGGLAALEEALDAIFADASSWPGLVIDVRINGGGEDPYGLAIASRLTGAEYVAYSKQARSDPANLASWTDPQPSVVRPSTRPSFHGPVVELTGILSVSAAETFTQALLKRTPHITRVGENTQGVFSDVLGRRLPNGWRFGLPNERFVTDGKSYDGPGIAPDVAVPVFPKSDLEAGRDGALERALEILRQRPMALLRNPRYVVVLPGTTVTSVTRGW